MPFNLYKIGQLLREAREDKGLTFAEVAEVLFVRKRVIGAIEEGDWDHLPHPVYVKGYVTQYAAFLNIPGLPLSETEGASREDESFVQGPGTSKRKEGVLQRWRSRNKRAKARRSLNVPWSVRDQL